MSDYKELVEELRYGAEYGCDADLIERAADAIEELVADLGDADAMTEMWMRKHEALQAQLPKRGEWIETEEEEWGIYPFKKQTCSVCDCKIDHTFMLACMDYFDDRDTVFHYCPNCGAKMEPTKEDA